MATHYSELFQNLLQKVPKARRLIADVEQFAMFVKY